MNSIAGNLTLYACGEEISSTTHKVFFTSKLEGNGSYSLTKTDGSVCWVSKLILLHIIC